MTTDSHSTARTLANELTRLTGLNPAKCYQCGKCTAGCPMGEEMDFGPHEIIRLVQMNRAEQIYSNASIWLCATCETCTARCPNSCDPARTIDGLRELSLHTTHKARGAHRIKTFNDAFLDQVKMFGRLYEMGMIGEYKLRTGALLDDVLSAPGMFFRGKLKLVPQMISPEGRQQVQRIFDACKQEETA